ncbi:CDP-glycerol glycerophosphotransferase family protein [Psychrobium sp. 1_MG-2023]|uniref:CDP-glycerol glycerophosphotransferase family protein n=1 Tax=Psychrobium sp. 1_MG-2023 TaxID=3062624 RepID=UPI000C337D42|nr:CDP-glycerol glycerophosphotransferase family protein [Psychrobium sp. 1_MG-2023]MDP2562538.1 CDP-glycerol glycerophosphotransferase family protein [Psychrobium sp. 1_MG-2023]PKF57970.1 CDP-glycerol--poly(glycerophosphate) glycerophosphotransferase [Alteromonadales bacterium alter-6D02]
MFVIFDTVNVYYLPQYLPICEQLRQQGHRVKFVCYSNKNKADVFEQLFAQLGVDFSWVENEQAAAQLYVELKPDWIFFGNAFSYLDDVHQSSKTAQLGHGVGPKPSYYHKSVTPMTVRFMEGAMRLEKIQALYPNDTFVQVGYSKLDPMYQDTETGLDFSALNLDPNKQTILYAPTFNPSSLECFPDDWPRDFANYNVLIKPHTFTYTREQYKKQRAKLAKWSTYPNAYVASEQDLSLLPFMKHADILLSEASSTLFEFAALDKPVIVCNFFKLKWSYRGPFRYRFEKRFGKDNVLYQDIGLHVQGYKELLKAIPQQLAQPQEYQAQRTQYTHDHVGPTDGLASKRIVQYIEQH